MPPWVPGHTVARAHHDNRKGRGRAALAAVALACTLAGCAGVPAEPPPAGDGPAAACRAFFGSLDAEVEAAGVRDGIGAPPARYPFLRGTRFLGSFADELDTPAVRTAWLDAAQALDREARRLELRNLPDEARARLAVPAGAASARAAVATCGATLRRASGLDRAGWPEAAAALEVPDEYITWHRVAGLYPVSRWFIGLGVSQWQRGVRGAFANDVPADPPGLRYTPAEPVAPADPTARLAEAPRDALGWPQLPPEAWRALFRYHAPVIEVAADRAFDRMGAVVLDEQGTPGVATARPRVYTHASAVRFRGETLVQLNYIWWFPERPVDHWLDLLGGRLDGLDLRLTLDGDGRLLLVETMHNCGCYHQHYPVAGLEPRARPAYAERPLLLPGPGERARGERLRVRLESGSHYVSHLAFAPDPADRGTAYRLADYDRLRSLALGDGPRRRSLFDPAGLVPGTERGERWFLWVSGVPEPGAMRQYYRHATAFVGRRHFDDPDLLERIYRRVPAD